jgi:hypothetical protein
MKKIILLISIFTFCSISITFAEKPAAKVQFGYVNVAEIILLHPTMKNFDSKLSRFSLNAIDEKNIKQKEAENRKNLDKELAQVKADISKLKKERDLEEKKYLKATKKLVADTKLGTKGSQISTELYNEKRSKLDREFYAKLSEIKSGLNQMENKQEKLSKERNYTSFATHKETAKVFEIILDDSYKAIDAIANHYEIPFVFNSSFAFDRSFSSKVTSNNPMKNFFQEDLTKVEEDPEEAERNRAEALKTWLENKNRNLMNCADPRLARFVLKGGINMTPAVIDYIYQKYDVKKEQRDFIQKFYQKLIEN